MAGRSNSCPAIGDLGMANMSYCQGKPWGLQHVVPAVQGPPLSSEGDRNRDHDSQALIKEAGTNSQFGYDPL